MDAGLKAALLLASAALAGCAQLGYYTHLARGQIELLSKRERIEAIVGDPSRDAELRRRLGLVLEARRFAVESLALPDNASYTLYADLGRPYVLWNVFATPEFSLAPVESCFPISGCVAYRGHYSRERADAYAETLRVKGYDVEIGGVPAYSTLGWFDDPVLNTMLHWSDAVLIGTVFHELAHQRLYAKDDTTFNESYARFVEQEGARQYFGVDPRGEMDSGPADRQREAQFVALVIETRRQLETLYAQPLSPDAMREAKRATFADLQRRYAALRDSEWNGAQDYERWFARELNNASLLPVGLYDEWVPAFRVLFAQADRDWTRFHAECARLGALPQDGRRQRLAELQAAAEVQRKE